MPSYHNGMFKSKEVVKVGNNRKRGNSGCRCTYKYKAEKQLLESKGLKCIQFDSGTTGVDLSHIDRLVIMTCTFSGANFIQGITRMCNANRDKTMPVDAILSKTDDVKVSFERNSELLTTEFSSTWFDSLTRSLPPVIGSLNQDYPAMKAGMLVGDRIVAINGNKIKTWHELTEVIHASPDSNMLIEWSRGTEMFASAITPHKEKMQGKEIGLIGIGFAVQDVQLNFFESLAHGYNYCVHITQLTYHYVKLVIKGEQSFKDAFGGPIMIAKLAKDSAREGESNFIAFIAFLSLNLGLLNLLPIPALDGGHIIFLLIEGIARRPVPDKAKIIIQQVGMFILIAFMLFVIVNDITRLSQ